ncbi:MAG: hypothetical protein R2825_07810 [Saprospiraceae bacterium]
MNVDCANGQVAFTITDDTDLRNGQRFGFVKWFGAKTLPTPPISNLMVNGGAAQTDADLEYLSNLFNGASTQDACIVTLDVLAASEN